MSARQTVRLTMAQALTRYLAALRVQEPDGSLTPYVGGVWAIFGHGNVAGMGQALADTRDALPVMRAHNEQAMAHAAIAYAKAHMRRRIMVATTSIGPGATNMVTAAALAHVNRLPVLLLPGDTFASRAPDPVLQQIESFDSGDTTANDVFRPVSRYFDRLVRPEQILTALPRAIQVMTDPAQCGPATLALPQDVQTQAFDCPTSFLQPAPLHFLRPPPDAGALQRAAQAVRGARRPLLVVGGGALYARASQTLAAFATTCGVPVAETQAGKGTLAWDHSLNLGAIGVTGSPAANAVAERADLIIAVGTRLQDFTTGSNALFGDTPLLSINVQALDAGKRRGQALVADAALALAQLGQALTGWRADTDWTADARRLAAQWRDRVLALTTAVPEGLPYEADVIGAVQSSDATSASDDIVVSAAGTLPAELHKLWRSSQPGGYHVEYGYSCMGYEIAGGLGVKLARPGKEVIVLVGDGSYLMMNSEIATAAMLGIKLIIVVLDNRGFGCINRLQRACGGENYNNLLDDCVLPAGVAPRIDFAAHARSLGAHAMHVHDVAELTQCLREARASPHSTVLVIDTSASRTTSDGGCWWEVAVPEVCDRVQSRAAHAAYVADKRRQEI
ncbi:3D-(3,5/4)-trihydroxycyclohexane-1,2-dione acylhydrolase (decyclizing) [Achromobacter sp. ESBL13]|uniref:3D-(3,5/4)-trihydroxycyclohexane-1,2-dione acylhydrolase (decyclizing) n=1 Tax=Achromobacter sp. ESBL13 TaxID=3077328 RepID=UPI002FCC139C